ncbi:MAG: septum formation initiator family protein [Bacteroidales bacterium]|nr:septum formation initiator family protein [Bacteroidales bacterium]MDD4670521.1 septum formation initiator family protein [Bacteroidales bacterium]
MFNKIKIFFTNLYAKKFWHIVLNKYFIATLIFICGICFTNSNNIGLWIKTSRTIKAQEQQIRTYQKEIENTDNKLIQLQSKKDSLEKFAREQYLFHEDSEVVYVVE